MPIKSVTHVLAFKRKCLQKFVVTMFGKVLGTAIREVPKFEVATLHRHIATQFVSVNGNKASRTTRTRRLEYIQSFVKLIQKILNFIPHFFTMRIPFFYSFKKALNNDPYAQISPMNL